MADRFRADPEAAGRAADELARIRADLAAAERIIEGYEQATGSSRVRDALRDFFDDSSDNREKMNDLLERASGLLRGLSEGTRAVDVGLGDALEPPPEQPQPEPAGRRP